MNTTLNLNAQESLVFFNIINRELGCCINQWDADTHRCPSQKRLQDSQYAKVILDKWDLTQNVIKGTLFINLDNVIACNLTLTKPEVTYVKNLLNKAIKSVRKELSNITPPYMGVYQVIYEESVVAENIVAKL